MSAKDYDSLTEEERNVQDAKDRERERQEQAALPYSWSQDLQTVTVNVPLPKGIKSKDLIVVMDRRKLKVGGVQVKGAPEPIMEGELFEDIAKDDSSWTIDSGVLTFELEKFSAHINSHRWWPHVLTKDPKIDTTKIQPENTKLSDLDGETRAMVEKMMHDNKQKQLGEPTSDELKKLEMIEKFKRQHPEMDFSNAKIE
ncbi:Nuclear movement protein nudC [Vanrija pseudolonga]|uniref:Nuclear movement protein nudC n=1 Tax=Vanrija pseudolonga TaxID=143232 RepID=A0AAF0YAE0_9TREE|nr:Nuclear movement protein nudC [Vanrija pseudolonga]